MNSTSGFLPVRSRANVTVALIAVSACIGLLSIMYELDLRGILDRLSNGQLVTYNELDTADDRSTLVAILGLAAFIATATAFIAWFHRAYTNIERLGASDLRVKRGWAIGAWFVPFLNLVRPKQIMDDIWRASDPALPATASGSWQLAAVPGLLHAWWALFLVSGIVGNISARMMIGADTPDELQSATTVSLWADVVSIVAAGLGILVVGAVTSRQEERASRVAQGGLPPASAAAWAPERPAGLEAVSVWPPISG